MHVYLSATCFRFVDHKVDVTVIIANVTEPLVNYSNRVVFIVIASNPTATHRKIMERN